ncbi:MAG: GNAT family N-acetyltransferase [Caldilineaceae bacterium]|nr:GNAT family N-acetyltransferase [Caldilineaceae bacterium]
MHITDLSPHTPAHLEQAARLLVTAFAAHWPNAWPDMDAARAEVADALQEGHINRVAVNDRDNVIGWIGGQPAYSHGWELHPLVVDAAWQGQGIGRALVADLETQVKARGGLVLYLGSDDEDNMTSLAGADLLAPDPWPHIARIRNLRRHPYEFYQKLGFTIVGVIPDANGPGKPDILMAKRIG